MGYLDKPFNTFRPLPVDALSQMPIWKRWQETPQPQLIAFKGSRICLNKALLSPWATGSGSDNDYQFIDPEDLAKHPTVLGRFGLQEMSTEEIWKEVVSKRIPERLNPRDVAAYHNVMRELYRAKVFPPSSLLAPDGNLLLCKANTLFDHEIPLYQSSFRMESRTKFLAPSMRSLMGFWRKLGLRSNDGYKMPSDNFLQCVSAIERRVKKSVLDEYIRADANKLLEFLAIPRDDFQHWHDSTFTNLSRRAITPVRKLFTNQPLYRQARMLEVASREEFWALESCSPSKYIDIVWSQRPMTLHEPCKHIWDNIKAYTPSVPTVYKHLLFLANLRKDISGTDLERYLGDIKACYAFLEDKPFESIPGIKKDRVWFNLRSADLRSIRLEDLKDAVVDLKHLILHTPHGVGKVKAVNPFLMTFERLLKRAGCSEFQRPKPAPEEQKITGLTTIEKIRAFREKGQHFDFTLKARDGQELQCHRVILAAQSEYCSKRISDSWIDKNDPMLAVTFKSLKTIIDFAYNEDLVLSSGLPSITHFDDLKRTADVLDELLDLLQATDYMRIERLHTEVENHIMSAHETLIRLDSVTSLIPVVKGLRAPRLLKYCEELAQINSSLVKQIDSEEGLPYR
jgi:BTB/POZ domain